ncbi:hypothetical protein SUGI_1063220 [Cryptomeria japonica]|nr:hypothetical protein SUGI_1063220 [Cryptomeria japonica]
MQQLFEDAENSARQDEEKHDKIVGFGYAIILAASIAIGWSTKSDKKECCDKYKLQHLLEDAENSARQDEEEHDKIGGFGYANGKTNHDGDVNDCPI